MCRGNDSAGRLSFFDLTGAASDGINQVMVFVDYSAENRRIDSCQAFSDLAICHQPLNFHRRKGKGWGV